MSDKILGMFNDFSSMFGSFLSISLGLLGIILLADAIKTAIDKTFKYKDSNLLTKFVIAIVVIFLFFLVPVVFNMIGVKGTRINYYS